MQEGKISGSIEQAEKENKQPGKNTTHLVTGGKEVKTLLKSESSKNRKSLLSPVPTKESWASKNTPFDFSPFSIEKMRSENLSSYLYIKQLFATVWFLRYDFFPLAPEKNASLSRSFLTPVQPLCISPIGAVSPPMELPSHLNGIQASSFDKTPERGDIVKSLPRPFATPVAPWQRAQEVCMIRSMSGIKIHQHGFYS